MAALALMRISPTSLFAVALFHGAALMLQLLLTRIFAITIFYHFAFMVISLVMLGLSLAGLTVHFLARHFTLERASLHLTLAAVAAGLSTVAVLWIYLQRPSAIVAFDATGLTRLTFTLLLFILPQFLIGLVSSLLFHHFPDQAGRIYFADLLGAGLGCVALVPLSYALSGPTLICFTALAMATAGLIFGWQGSGRQIGVFGVVIAGLVLALQSVAPVLKITHSKFGEEKNIVLERWNPISRVTVETRDIFDKSPLGPDTNGDGERGFHFPNAYWIKQDGTAGTPIYPWSETDFQRDHMRASLHGLPYELASAESVFIIGVGGGKDIMTALTYGVPHIVGAEINPSIAAVLREDMRDHVGGLLEEPSVTLKVDEARAALLASHEKFDLIQLTFIDSFTGTLAGHFAMIENHLYTQEAIDTYLDHLNPGGTLSIIWWHFEPWPATMARLYATGADALRSRGVADPTANILYLTDELDPPVVYMGNLQIRLNAWSADEVENVQRLADERGIRTIVLPGLPSDQDFMAGVVEAAQFDDKPFHDLLRSLSIDIAPVWDDSPYIHLIHTWSNLSGEGVPDSLAPFFQAPRALHLLVKVLAVLCAVLIGLPIVVMALRHGRAVTREMPVSRLIAAALYVIGLGFGFLLIEIALVHQLIVYLGHPLYGVSVGLATLLVASGVGAGVLMRRGADPRGRLRALTVRLAVILVFVITAYFGLHALLEDTRGAPLPVRLFTAIAVVALFGLPMGTAFPMGLEILTARVPRAAGTLSPWLWAVNGAAGTLASAVSILISIYLGFSACLLLGGAFYLVSLIAAPVFLRRAA